MAKLTEVLVGDESGTEGNVLEKTLVDRQVVVCGASYANVLVGLVGLAVGYGLQVANGTLEVVPVLANGTSVHSGNVNGAVSNVLGRTSTSQKVEAALTSTADVEVVEVSLTVGHVLGGTLTS